MNDIFDDSYLPIEEAAQRLGLSSARVQELVLARVLRAYADGGVTLVQPALVRGLTCG